MNVSSRQIYPDFFRPSSYTSGPKLPKHPSELSASVITTRPGPLMESLDSPQPTTSLADMAANEFPSPRPKLGQLSQLGQSSEFHASTTSRPVNSTRADPSHDDKDRGQRSDALATGGKKKRRTTDDSGDTATAKRGKNSSKSRNGCNTCKIKRLKCDEQKPECNNCLKKNIVCGGYAQRFKWRNFSDGKEEPRANEPFAGRKTNDANKLALVQLTPNAFEHNVIGPNSTHENGGPGRNAQTLITKKHTSKVPFTSNINNKVPSKISPAKLTVMVKSEDVEMKPLSLSEHMELAALSVVGKSSKEIEFEHDLLAKGINPQAYYDHSPGPTGSSNGVADQRQRMHRSFSSHDLPVELPAAALQRSQSMSTYNIPSEVQSFRAAHSSTGLHSLAEVAIDEMRTRSPASTPAHLNVPFSSASPDSLPLSHFYGEKTPRISSAVPTPKPWLFNPLHVDPMHGHTKDGPLPEINLTPSLSAIINYAFHEDGHKFPHDQYSAKLLAAGGGAPSPLDLNLAHQLDVMSPVDRRRASVASSLHKVTTPGPMRGPEHDPNTNELLYEVGTQLIREAHPSPSIVRSVSSESLLRSSEREQILFLYSTFTCGIMSIKSGASENPWKNMYLPISSDYPYLFNSIASMTLFHLASNNKIGQNSAHLRSKGYSYMKSCILELASGLSKMENSVNCDFMFPADVALATCLNLAVSESWDTHISSGIAHLKGANSMIQKVLTVIKLYLSKKNKGDSVLRAALKKKLVFVNGDEWKKIEEFDLENKGTINNADMYIPRNLQLLFNQWIYFEVLSQMTCYNGQDIKGIDLVATITKIIQTTEKKRDDDIKGSRSSETASPLGSQDLHGSIPAMSEQFHYLEDFELILQNVDYVDPLLGCAQSLFLIMGRVANLISKVRISKEADKKQVRNSLKNISLASELKQQLVDWRPNISAQMAELGSKEAKDSSWDFYSCISTAEAYRYATLLYLHEAVPEVPLISSHQLAEKIFVLLASIPSNSNLFIVHIFPLLVGSCEAEPGEEREWCLSRWVALLQKLWIGNIDRAFEVVKEVWKRKDEQVQKSNEGSLSEKLDLDDPRDFSVHLHGLMSNNNKSRSHDEKGIISNSHWSTIMREWGWEVLLA